MAATIVQSAICRTSARIRPTPSLFFFPGLTSAPFWDAQSFPWACELESATEEIRSEFLAMRAQGEPSDYAVGQDEHTLHDGRWDWLSWRQGTAPPSERFERECPRTVSLLRAVPGLMTDMPFSYSFFSTLHADSAIAPHAAPCNLRLRCHLPLIVPPPPPPPPPPSESEPGGGAGCEGDATCGMRVAEIERPWEVGKCTLFDDCYEHETWNDTNSERVVLLFDVWHPELTLQERAAIQDMFAQSLANKNTAAAAAPP
jgi:aspartate beta-hydroxylase